jgi:hypothetical protein
VNQQQQEIRFSVWAAVIKLVRNSLTRYRVLGYKRRGLGRRKMQTIQYLPKRNLNNLQRTVNVERVLKNQVLGQCSRRDGDKCDCDTCATSFQKREPLLAMSVMSRRQMAQKTISFCKGA